MLTLRSLLTALILATPLLHSRSLALEIAPGTTSPSLESAGCLEASGQYFGETVGVCQSGCVNSCNAAEHTAKAALGVTQLFLGSRFVETTVYTDFTVKPSDSGEETVLDATIDYDVQWAGGWTIAGFFTGWNEANSAVSVTLFDLTDGKLVRSSTVHTMDVDGFVGIDLADVGFGLDQGSEENGFDARVVRGHTYRLGVKIRCDGRGRVNAAYRLDYAAPGWGAWWNDMKVTVSADLAEEIEKLKRRVEALEEHTHTYLTGRGEGHNNTEAETSKPILVVEEPTDEEQRLLPEDSGKEPLPVKSVFLANAPNPFNPATTITYTLPEPLRVTIRLYTAQGQLARTLVEGDRPSGPHAFAFDAAGMASGVYYYRLTAGRFTETRKLTIVR